MKLVTFVAVVLCYTLVDPCSARSQSTRITVSYSADTPAYLPVFTAKEAGIFSKNGLDVQLVRIAGAVAVMALIAGESPICQVGGSAVIASNLGGSDAVIVAAGSIATDYIFVSQKDIKTAARLKGGILGVSTLSGSAIFASYLHYENSVSIRTKMFPSSLLGQTSDRFLALRTGRVQATLLTPPHWIIAEREGFNILTDVTELPFPYNTVSTTRRYARDNPDTVRKFVKSQIDAVHLLKTDRETGLKVLAKYLRQKLDREILERTYDQAVTDAVLPRKQYPDFAGVKTVLDLISDPEAAKAKPEQFADTRFVKELDDTGYIDSLYKRVSKDR